MVILEVVSSETQLRPRINQLEGYLEVEIQRNRKTPGPACFQAWETRSKIARLVLEEVCSGNPRLRRPHSPRRGAFLVLLVPVLVLVLAPRRLDRQEAACSVVHPTLPLHQQLTQEVDYSAVRPVLTLHQLGIQAVDCSVVQRVPLQPRRAQQEGVYLVVA